MSGGTVFQTIGKIVDAVSDSLAPASPGSAPVDIKQAALELVMPKLDAETIAKYVGKWSENLEKDLEEKKEQERLAKEEQERRQNLGLEKPEEKSLLAKIEEDRLKNHTIKELSSLDLADALRQAGRRITNDGLKDAKLEEERLRLGQV